MRKGPTVPPETPSAAMADQETSITGGGAASKRPEGRHCRSGPDASGQEIDFIKKFFKGRISGKCVGMLPGNRPRTSRRRSCDARRKRSKLALTVPELSSPTNGACVSGRFRPGRVHESEGGLHSSDACRSGRRGCPAGRCGKQAACPIQPKGRRQVHSWRTSCSGLSRNREARWDLVLTTQQ